MIMVKKKNCFTVFCLLISFSIVLTGAIYMATKIHKMTELILKADDDYILPIQ